MIIIRSSLQTKLSFVFLFHLFKIFTGNTMAATQPWARGHEYLTDLIVNHPLRALFVVICFAFLIQYVISTGLEYLVRVLLDYSIMKECIPDKDRPSSKLLRSTAVSLHQTFQRNGPWDSIELFKYGMQTQMGSCLNSSVELQRTTS